MLEFYIQNRKRWNNRSLNKRRRALLNGISSDGEPSWGSRYIPALRREWARDSVSSFNRYLRRQVGKRFADVYSDLSHRPIYRQERYLLKEAFMREMQWEDEYRRYWNEFIELVPNTYVPQSPLQLRAYDTGFDRFYAKYLVWYPYRKGRQVVIDKGDPPITGYLYGVGWHGYYTRTEKVYNQELLLDKEGRPLFTKQEYEIHTRDGSRRLIPVGGPLLRETVTTTTKSEWRYLLHSSRGAGAYLGNGWKWHMRTYAGSEGELQRLRRMLWE